MFLLVSILVVFLPFVQDCKKNFKETLSMKLFQAKFNLLGV